MGEVLGTNELRYLGDLSMDSIWHVMLTFEIDV